MKRARARASERERNECHRRHRPQPRNQQRLGRRACKLHARQSDRGPGGKGGGWVEIERPLLTPRLHSGLDPPLALTPAGWRCLSPHTYAQHNTCQCRSAQDGRVRVGTSAWVRVSALDPPYHSNLSALSGPWMRPSAILK